MKIKYLTLFAAAAFAVTGTAAFGENFNVPGGDLKAALKVYTTQSGVLLLVPADAVSGVKTGGVKGDLSANDALLHILKGTGFVASRGNSGQIEIIRDGRTPTGDLSPDRTIAAASAPSVSGAALETVTVTSSKIGGDVQNIPISITALSQEQLTSRQIAGGPDLVKEVPNLTFSKTNFTGYNIQIRGIGTQAISVTTDPAVAVALNDIPFIRNHFFEQEFYDVGQVEVLRGPQGTLYGRNATAGVVNVVSAKPSDQFEAMASADIGNYQNRRFEGMINMPIVDDRLDIRVAGEWTKRNGYSFNELTDTSIDGRDLWSGRVSIGWKASKKFQAYLIWEHFSEDDDRMRTAKQLCKKDPGPSIIDGVPVVGGNAGDGNGGAFMLGEGYLSQGCLPTSMYGADAFEVPDGFAIPYVIAAGASGAISGIDPYASTRQSHDLRVIESTLNPAYKAKNDTVELNADYTVAPSLTFTSQTGFNQDFLWSTEDYNRFNTAPGLFLYVPPDGGDTGIGNTLAISPDGVFCDPQVGCSNRLVAQDLSEEHAWQLNQELRLASKFSGPLNFSFGGNYMHYETEENYYVFVNALTVFAVASRPQDQGVLVYIPGVSDHHECMRGLRYGDPLAGGGVPTTECVYIDPNPITKLNGNGHNYFVSKNPYALNSYAAFGEAYYELFHDLKLTAGLRWTDDRKHFTDIPSEAVVGGWGYPSIGVVDQQWNELTGRFAANWTPKLEFTDQTLIYGSYAHGYKAGGANPPGAVFDNYSIGVTAPATTNFPIHPLTFKPEFIDAFELGSKNTLLDGALTLNGDVFYYNYEAYQISEIVDRTSINLNFDAHVKGAEIEATWEPTPGLKFSFAGGYEDARLAKGSKAVDLIDRTAGQAGWVLVKPFATEASNCILPDYVVAVRLASAGNGSTGYSGVFICGLAYTAHEDPNTCAPYVPNPDLTQATDGCINTNGVPPGYRGFDPSTAPNNGAGFDKDLSHNDLPNAPHFTASFTAEYSMPVSEDWAASLHSDFYWQAQSFGRVFNDRPYDEIHGYSNVNLALIFTNENGWQVLGYLKNVFNTTAITGTFLNSDDSGLTTNVFLTDPRLFGVRVTKNF